jgi:preprotein translocase subunit SecY
MKKWVSILLIVFLAIFVCISFVNAQGAFKQAKSNLQKGGERAYGEGTEPNLSVVVGNVVNGILVVSGILLATIILRGGFLYMTAGGDTGKVDKGKDWIRNGIIGLIICLLAYSSSSYVMNWVIASIAS